MDWMLSAIHTLSSEPAQYPVNDSEYVDVAATIFADDVTAYQRSPASVCGGSWQPK